MTEPKSSGEKIPMKKFDTIVLSGGGVKGIAQLGAVQYCIDNNLIDVHTYVGTSCGAIVGYLLAIGYSPIELMVYLRTHSAFDKAKGFNLVAMANGNGAMSYTQIQEILEEMTIQKIGQLLTLRDLHNNMGKTLIVCTYNETLGNVEAISYLNYPDLPCLVAVRMSSNLPLIFPKFNYLSSFYIDGGIVNNFPVDIAVKHCEDHGGEILGLNIKVRNGVTTDPSDNVLQYMYKLIFIPINKYSLTNAERMKDRATIIHIVTPDISICNFSAGTKANLDMFSSGYAQTQKFFSTPK